MVMTCRHAPSPAHLVLLVLLFVTRQLAGAAPVWGEGGEGGAEREEEGREGEGRARTDLRDDGGGLSLPRLSDPGRGGGGDNPVDPAQLLRVLLEALDHPGARGGENTGGDDGGDTGTAAEQVDEGGEEEEVEEEEEEEGGGGRTRVGRVWDQSYLTASREDVLQGGGEEEEKRPGEDGGRLPWDTGVTLREEQEEGDPLPGPPDHPGSRGDAAAAAVQRKTRGYFQNIDLGLQDNEILPPLKGYKAYNTQLARAGKKQRWQEERAGNRPAQGGNFMDEFDTEGEEPEDEAEKDEEGLSRAEEEARARAEKQEVLRQQEEAERAREEEQRLADIASDMLLRYMGRKQPPYMAPRQKSSGVAVGNTAEDKRSEEVAADDDDMDQQMIDRLIEISSKLHLPADDVVEIISDVEEKKKKRKELQNLPSSNNGGPVTQRFRPLVPPPLAAPPMYHYTASGNPKKAPYRYRSNKKWQKDKVKSYKQDFWYKPQKQLDYWYKPQKQFLAFPSYPYYQKPYRAYYPVYFPYPKQHYYGKPSPSMDQPFGPQELDIPAPRRRFRPGGKGRGGQGWRQQPPPQIPIAPYISNYILPHPRTYQPLPPPKPVTPTRRGRRPHYFYPQVTPPADDYEEDGLVPQLDSEEELENFIERIYMKRRMY
ncbi:hypothetical protein NHX12_009472 [Muraenolepis orangiensis]|uniref:Neurosecretory protein VGF n=1 Tax=Muraenolepis orangiensis TaxID=630683 RepID=A0A9Q0DJF5_9TELE|nr:hypothetical protein NHX12_009472 [Muraenolepis orangiensis]